MYIDLDRFTCPQCKTVLSPDTFPFKWTAVAGLGSESIARDQYCSCGFQFTVDKCQACGKGIFQNTGKSILGPGGYVHYHKSCAERTGVLAKPAPSNAGCVWAFLLIAGLLFILATA